MDDPDSWFAAEGTVAHTVSEWARNEGKSAHEYIGRKLEVGPFEFVVDDKMANAVDEFCEYVAAIPGFPLYEVRVHYDHWVSRGFGTLDDARVEDGTCHVTDLKYGKGILVEAHDNSQLKLYALGLYHDYKYLWRFDKFVLTVYQPRLNNVDVYETNLKDLLTWANDVVAPTAQCALLPGAPLKAGAHCQFCPAKRTCKVRADWVMKTVAGEWGDLDAPQELALLSNDDIARILPNLGGVRKWCKDIEGYALRSLARGEAIGDWKVVEGRSNRAYSVPDEKVAAALEPELGEDVWKPREIISVAQAEKKLGRKRAALILPEISHKPPGKPKLAPGTDKRPALVLDPTMEFRNLDDDDE
jgi:hypothetical protein